MNEKLLQFIWQHQYFRQGELITVEGEPLTIIQPGKINRDQGPDFLHAKIKIGPTLLAGSIELHLQSSQWNDHRHSDDPNYENVILHVVWRDDGGTQQLPVLELQDRVPSMLLEHYQKLMQSPSFIPCAGSIASITPLHWNAWKDRLVAERLLRKGGEILAMLEHNEQHWEETCWWLLAKAFGGTINGLAFEAIARSLPLNLLGRHRHSIHQLEALLLGQAGLLEKEWQDHYPVMLQREYAFLQKKYHLRPIHQPVHFLRMRPSNFPTVRLAQLAMLIHQQQTVFSNLLEETLPDFRSRFLLTANDYWHSRYRPDEPSPFLPKTTGEQFIHHIIANTAVPLLFAYGLYRKEAAFQQKAIQWLGALPPEVHRITRGFAGLGVANDHCFDSQALLELKKQYCDLKHCLRCGVGHALLKRVSLHGAGALVTSGSSFFRTERRAGEENENDDGSKKDAEQA